MDQTSNYSIRARSCSINVIGNFAIDFSGSRLELLDPQLVYFKNKVHYSLVALDSVSLWSVPLGYSNSSPACFNPSSYGFFTYTLIHALGFSFEPFINFLTYSRNAGREMLNWHLISMVIWHHLLMLLGIIFPSVSSVPFMTQVVSLDTAINCPLAYKVTD